MRTNKGGWTMKYLKIDEGNAFFLDKNSDYASINEITKEDLMYLIDCAVDDSLDFEMDDFNEFEIHNPAHQIVYSNLYQKLMELANDKERFMEESKSMYFDAKVKYGIK